VPHQRASTGGRPDAAGARADHVGDGGRARPAGGWPLTAAAIVVAVETAVLAASAIGFTIYRLLGHSPHDSIDGWMIVLLAALAAAGLGCVWRGVYRRRRWARSPAVLAQLLAIPVGVDAAGDGAWWIGAPLLLCAVVGLLGLFAPSSTHAFVDG